MPWVVGPQTISLVVDGWEGYVRRFGNRGLRGIADWRCWKVDAIEAMPETTGYERYRKDEERAYWMRIFGRMDCEQEHQHVLPRWDQHYGMLMWRCKRCADWLYLTAEEHAEWDRKHEAWLRDHPSRGVVIPSLAPGQSVTVSVAGASG